MQDGRRFATALELALIAGKPVVLVKSGRTEAGQIAASTHTAALAGSDRVFSAVCRQFGVILVDDIDELIDTIQLMASFGERLAADGRVSVVSQSGGMGSLTADFCYRAGLHLSPISATLKEELLSLPHMPQIENLGNPSDVRGTAVIGEATTQTLAPFLRDPDTDVVVLLLAKSTLRAGEDGTALAIVKAAQAAQKPLIVVWVGQRTNGEKDKNRQPTSLSRRAYQFSRALDEP